MKKLYQPFFLFFITSTLFFAQTADQPSGTGTSGDPYQIATINNLYWITQNSADWDKYFRQTADIDASTSSTWDSGNGFSPIGNSTTQFTGEYDGDNYTISGLTIDRTSTQYVGMFGQVESSGNIFDLNLTSVDIAGLGHMGALVGENKGTISNCSVAGTVSCTGEWLGGFAGSNNGGSITNSNSSCTVTATNSVYEYDVNNSNSYPHNAGGFIAVNRNNGTIDNCYATGNVSTSGHVDYGNTLNTVGGFCAFVGTYEDDGGLTTISNCYAEGTVTGQGENVGGFAGIINPFCEISNCYATGNVTATSDFAGGFVGLTMVQGDTQTPTTISKCYATGSVTTTSATDGEGSYAGGFVGRNQDGTIIEECFATGNASAARHTGAGFAGGNTVSGTLISTIRNCYSRGNAESGRVQAAGAYNGGFCGWNEGTIEYCFSTGTSTAVQGGTPGGGFCGSGTGSETYTSCLYDSDLTGLSDTGNGEPETTANMKTQSTFTDISWDNTIWNMDAGVNDGYPHLDWQNPDGTPLPVELISFFAVFSDGSVLLTWQTATEVNNYGFEIERSSTNSDAGRIWETIGFKEGHGNSNSPKNYEFTDEHPPEGNLQYRLKQIDTDGRYEYYTTTTCVNNSLTDIKDPSAEGPTEFSLSQNFPNPFNPTTTIKYSIPKSASTFSEGPGGGLKAPTSRGDFAKVRLVIYDMLGREVSTLIDEKKSAGIYTVLFNAHSLSSGIYFYRLNAGTYSEVRRMVLVK